MGLLDTFKKKKEGDLPPPPPPRTGGLPPLPSHELEAPPAPAMPQAPAPKAMPEPIDLPDLEPLPEVPVVKDEPELQLPEPKVVEERSFPTPTLVQDATLERPAPAKSFEVPQFEEPAKPVAKVAPPVVQPRNIVRRTPEELFVSVSEYQDMKDSLATIHRSLEESESMINRMSELKNAEEELLDTWRGHLEDVEKKLSYVDQVIFEGE